MVGHSTPRSSGGYQGGRGPGLACDHPCGQGQAGRGWAGEEEPGETFSTLLTIVTICHAFHLESGKCLVIRRHAFVRIY